MATYGLHGAVSQRMATYGLLGAVSLKMATFKFQFVSVVGVFGKDNITLML
jgi:hypothetical protein